MGSISRGFLLSVAVGLALLCSPVAEAASKGALPPSLEQAEALIQAEEYEQAVGVLKGIALDDRAVSARVDLLLGRIYLAIGKPAKALDFFEAASFASLNDEAAAYLGLAEAKLALGSLAQARRDAESALRSDPDLVAAHLVLALIDQRLGQYGQAEMRLDELQQQRPDSEAVAIVAARYAARNDSPAAGAARLAQFIQRNPMSPAALDQLAQFEWASGRRVEAVRARVQASRLYHDRRQAGRVAAIEAWLKSVDPTGKLREQAAKEPEIPPPPVAAPPPMPATRPAEPPAVSPSPQPSSPAPVPSPGRRVALAPVLAQPEPLPFAPGSQLMTGSGIVLEGGRTIITNRHVVEGMRTFAVRNGTGYVRHARVVRTSSEDDLALLEIDAPFPEGSAHPFAGVVDANPGRPAIVMGYPLINILGDEQPALTEGIVAKTMGLGNDPNSFQMTTKINKGNSGGPVFDRSGRLIGVAVAKVDVASIFEKRGFLVEDMNLGIKAGRILHFLGQSARPPAAAPPEITLEELYQEMLPRVVLIAGQK